MYKLINIDNIISIMPSIVAILYAAVGLCYLLKKDFSWSLVWFSYAMANVGLILVGMRK